MERIAIHAKEPSVSAKLILNQLAINKVSFSSGVLNYHDEIGELNLPINVWILHNSYLNDLKECPLCILRVVFLNFLTDGKTLELIGIDF